MWFPNGVVDTAESKEGFKCITLKDITKKCIVTSEIFKNICKLVDLLSFVEIDISLEICSGL